MTGALFYEGGVRGCIYGAGLRQGSATCRWLWIAILPDRIRIVRLFPANLLFIPERFGIEHDIPMQHITSFGREDTSCDRPTGGSIGESEIFNLDGSAHSIELQLRNLRRRDSPLLQQCLTPRKRSWRPIVIMTSCTHQQRRGRGWLHDESQNRLRRGCSTPHKRADDLAHN